MSNPSLHAPKPIVLIVDDQHDSADTLACLLPLVYDCTPYIAYSGAEALALAELVQPEIVILDITMPGMDGCEAARRMREQAWGKSAFIVTLSGWADDQGRCCDQAKVNFHLSKPVGIDNLLCALANRQACLS